MQRLFLFIVGGLIFSIASLFGQSTKKFSANTIVALIDADMAATTFSDGELKREEGKVDLFCKLSTADDQMSLTETPVSSSAVNWSKGLTVSKDGTVAFVTEARAMPSEDIQKVGDVYASFPEGRMLSAVSITDTKLITAMDIGKNPTAVQMNPAGNLLAVSTEQYLEEIVLIEWKDNMFGNIQTYPHGFEEEVHLTDISWHPSGSFLAVTIKEKRQIAFYKIIEQESYLSVEMWGEAIGMGGLPGAGRFTPDGKHYLISNVQSENNLGEMVSIAFDAESGDHVVNGLIPIGVSPEGFAISSTGEFIAVACKNGTFYPKNDERWTSTGSLILLQFDGNVGQFEVVDSIQFEGMLPRNVLFDKDDDMLAVSIYQYHDLTQRRGGISFFSIDKTGEAIELKKSIYNASLPSGCHSLYLVN